MNRLMSTVVILTVLPFLSFCASNRPSLSTIKALPSQSGLLKPSATSDFQGSLVSYNMYNSGLITFGGIAKFELPLLGSFEVPINRHYKASPSALRSNFYNVAVGSNLDLGRITMQVVAIDPATEIVNLQLVDVRQTHFTDSFYGAQNVFVELDLSNEFARINHVDIQGGWSFWQSQNRDFDVMLEKQ